MLNSAPSLMRKDLYSAGLVTSISPISTIFLLEVLDCPLETFTHSELGFPANFLDKVMVVMTMMLILWWQS